MDVSLREYLENRIAEQDQRILALERLMDAKQKALALAVEKQEATDKARFAGVNEWRQTFGDMVNRTVTREVFDARLGEMERRLGEADKEMARLNGQLVTWGAALTVLATIISIVARFVSLGS